jgi:hypothetical protein
LKLIEKLPSEYYQGIAKYYGIFECPECGKHVKRFVTCGVQKTCGCVKVKKSKEENYRHGQKKLELKLLKRELSAELPRFIDRRKRKTTKIKPDTIKY